MRMRKTFPLTYCSITEWTWEKGPYNDDHHQPHLDKAMLESLFHIPELVYAIDLVISDQPLPEGVCVTVSGIYPCVMCLRENVGELQVGHTWSMEPECGFDRIFGNLFGTFCLSKMWMQIKVPADAEDE